MLDLLFQNIDLLIDVVLAFITMSLGLSLSKKDFTNIISFPGSLGIGLVAQMILHPISAILLMMFTDFSPEVKVGFIIITLCPGGVTSNLVSFLLKGNVALSISLTVVNGLLCMFTLPILVNVSLDYFINQSSNIELPLVKTITHIAMVTIVPALIGVLINSKFSDLAHKIRPVLKYLLPVLLLLIFGVKFLAPHDKGGIHLSSHELWTLGIWVLLLNLAGMILGYLLGSIYTISLQNKVTIMVEVGLQNTALALLVSGNILKNADMQKPAMVYAMLTFFSTFVFAWIIKTASIKLARK